MKELTTVFFIFLFTISVARSQVLDTAHHSSIDLHSMYLKKRAANNIAGWVLLGSGLIIAGASFLAYANNGFNGVWKQEGLFDFGAVTTVASIPFFVFAGINKHKAKLALKGESLSFGKLTPSAQSYSSRYAALSLRIDLKK